MLIKTQVLLCSSLLFVFFFFKYLFIIWLHGGLRCRMWDLFPCPEIEPRTSALPVQSLSHRDVPRDFVCLFCLGGGVCVCVCVCVFVFVLAKVEKRKGKKLCKQVWYWEWVNLLIVLPEDMQFTKTLCLYSIIYSKEEMVNCK